MTTQKRISRLLCGIFIIVAMVTMFLRAWNHFYVNDDVFYQYVLGEHVISSDDNDYSDGNRVDSIKKLIISQKNHYLYTNGRAVVHTIVQIFAGMLGYRCWAFFVAFLTGLTIWLFVRYTCEGKWRENPLIYGLVVICYLYLYPSGDNGSFYWLVFGMNYLFPMTMILIWLILLKKMVGGKEYKWPMKDIVIPVFSFLLGWTHEGFIVPLCGATFLYTLMNFRKINYSVLLMFISLWIGGLLLVCSPANYNRLGHSMIANILNGIDLYVQLRLIWLIALSIMMLYFVRGKYAFSVVGKTSIITLSFLISILFGFIANNTPWSMTGIQFYGSLLMFIAIQSIFNDRKVNEGMANIISISLISLIIIHQALIIETDTRLRQKYELFYSEYQESETGYVMEKKMDISPMIKPWIFDWFPKYKVEYVMQSLAVRNGTPEKWPIPLGEKDYDAIYQLERFFTNENQMPGKSKIYNGKRFYFVKISDLHDRYLVTYDNPTIGEADYLLLKLKVLFAPNAFDNTEIWTDAMFERIKDNDSIIMMKKLPSMWRRIKNIQALEDD